MTASARILVVDDEESIQRTLATLLRAQGYEVLEARTAASALDMFSVRRPDLVLLDLGLPDREGTDVCRRLRKKSPVPIVVLSARRCDADKVDALDLGADDYVTKPFAPPELLARIRAALRRAGVSGDAPESGQIAVGSLAIDFDRRRVVRDDKEIRLTPKEFALLALLARNADRVLTHAVILKALWGAHAVDQPGHLWVLMSGLRRKVEVDPARPRLLMSEPWVGYRLATESAPH